MSWGTEEFRRLFNAQISTEKARRYAMAAYVKLIAGNIDAASRSATTCCMKVSSSADPWSKPSFKTEATLMTFESADIVWGWSDVDDNDEPFVTLPCRIPNAMCLPQAYRSASTVSSILKSTDSTTPRNWLRVIRMIFRSKRVYTRFD